MSICTVKTFDFCRTIDSFIIGYAKQALSIFLVDLDLIMDVVSLRLLMKHQTESNLAQACSMLVELFSLCGNHHQNKI